MLICVEPIGTLTSNSVPPENRAPGSPSMARVPPPLLRSNTAPNPSRSRMYCC